MLTNAARNALLNLAQGACDRVVPNRSSSSHSRFGIACYDTERDKSITEHDAFAESVAAFQADPVALLPLEHCPANR